MEVKLLSILLVIGHVSCSKTGITRDIKWMEKVLNNTLKNYDKRIIPIDSESPVVVRVQFLLSNLAEIKPIYNHITIDVFLRLVWSDHRLRFDGNESYSVAAETMDLLWVPDLVFLLEKSGQKSSITKDNAFCTIDPSGRITGSHRFVMNLYCHMHLFFFPFDEQSCEIIISSYAYSKTWLALKWFEKRPVWIYKESKEAGKFNVIGLKTDSLVENNSMFGDYDILRLTLKLQRNNMPIILRVYVPLAVIVMMSWVCFWIDYRSIPARTSMSAALVLTMITFIASIQQTLPKLSTVRVLDIHMMVCFFYVFAGLVEYSIALSMDVKLRTEKRKKKQENVTEAFGGKKEETREREAVKAKQPMSADVKQRRMSLSYKLYEMHKQHSEEYHVLDRISMIVFPLSFLIYSVLYFVLIWMYRGSIE